MLSEHLARGYRAYGPWLSGIWPVVIEPLARGYRNPRCEHLARAYPCCDCPMDQRGVNIDFSLAADYQITDFFTKPLGAAMFTGFRKNLLF